MAALDTLAASRPVNRSAGMVQRMVVAWQHPDTRKIHPVGFLTYDGEAYRFGYIRNALRIEDFRPLLGFPDLLRGYSSGDLFPLFAQRAMDPRRPDYQCYVEHLGLQGEPGPWEQISRSQGRRQGDTLQLLPEPISVGDALTCVFLVNGMRYAHTRPHTLNDRQISVTRQQVEDVLARLRPGDALALTHESDNPANPLALMVTGSSVPVGWVPDLFVEDVQNLMQQTTVSVTVEHANGPDAPWHLRLLVRLVADPAKGYRFFTGEQWAPLAEWSGQ
jgi:hypothetical protein